MQKTGKSIVIIGGGIAGLSAGCYARMNGFRAQIFEMHDRPGGLCTAWTRHGYTFDGCIHHLAGAGPKSKLYGLWEELGVTKRHRMSFYHELVRVEFPHGHSLTVYTDLDRLAEHLRGLAPEDASLTDSISAPPAVCLTSI